jgi:hypothetical protein
MMSWRLLGTLSCVLAGTAPVLAQSVPLAEVVKPGDCFHVQLDMTLKGQLRGQGEDGMHNIPLEATATLTYGERILAGGSGPVVDKTARFYETAKATIQVGSDRSERTLRADRRLFVAQKFKDQGLVYSPMGPLTREEVDLTSQHFDTLSLAGMLPGKAVAVGDTWKVADAAVVGLCGFEGLTEHNLSGKLEAVKDDRATIRVTGKATGIDLGALAKLTIEATVTVDTRTQRIVGVEWQQKDDRDQGPASPATVSETTWKMKRQTIEQPAGLSEVALVKVPADFEPPAVLTQIDFRDLRDRYSLLHSRDWQVVSQTPDHAVLRLMDRGDFVAQATITPWTRQGPDRHLSPEEFKKAMNAMPGWEPESEVQAGEVPVEGHWVYRLSELGKLDGLDVLQNFYIVANPNGEQVVIVFTLTPKQVDKLGGRDLSFVGSLEVPASKK